MLTKNEALLFLATLVESNVVRDCHVSDQDYREFLVEVINSLMDRPSKITLLGDATPPMAPIRMKGELVGYAQEITGRVVH